MDYLARLHLRLTSSSGQDMAEYALIMAALIVAGIAAYESLGTAITAAIASITAVF